MARLEQRPGFVGRLDFYRKLKMRHPRAGGEFPDLRTRGRPGIRRPGDGVPWVCTQGSKANSSPMASWLVVSDLVPAACQHLVC